MSHVLLDHTKGFKLLATKKGLNTNFYQYDFAISLYLMRFDLH